jgi:predicted naringenin-chalcone synthase
LASATGKEQDDKVIDTLDAPRAQGLETQAISELLLSAIRSAVHRCRLDENEITTVGVALRTGMITPERAVEWLHEIGLVDHVIGERADEE